jgi:ATP-binding cassette subfamily B protein
MLSRLAAFRLERNLRYSAMQKTVHMPLGFLTKNSSGKMRKVIDYNAGIIHTFVTHQLPDLAGGITVFVARLILIFVFFWRLGFACLIPLVIAFFQFYIEYERGIPVVKVFV